MIQNSMVDHTLYTVYMYFLLIQNLNIKYTTTLLSSKTCKIILSIGLFPNDY